jgi:hypothetical protein
MGLGRKAIAFVLLGLFLPASTAQTFPLVWCFTPSGHNAIELCAVTRGCHYIPAASNEGRTAVKAGKHGECTDIDLTQFTQSPSKLQLTGSPPSDPVVSDLRFKRIPGNSNLLRFGSLEPLDAIATQLAQLRTVVLLI